MNFFPICLLNLLNLTNFYLNKWPQKSLPSPYQHSTILTNIPYHPYQQPHTNIPTNTLSSPYQHLIIFNHKWHVFATVIKIFYKSTHLGQYNTQRFNNMTVCVTNKYLKLFSLCLNLSSITVLLIFTKSKTIGHLEPWNLFLLISTSLTVKAFPLILIVTIQKKIDVYLSCR